MNKLASDLLGGDATGRDMLASAEAINCRLKQIKPAVEKAISSSEGPPLSPLESATILGTEAALLSQPLRRERAVGDGDGSSSLREDAIASAVSTSAFYQCEAKLSDLCITTVEGRRKAIEAGFLSRCAVIAKVLLWGDKSLAKRHPLLAKMLELRGGSNLSGLVEYFSHIHAVDLHSGQVPQRAQKFSVAGDIGTFLEELQKFLKLNLHEINWFCTRTGIYALRMALTGATLSPLDPRDVLCV